MSELDVVGIGSVVLDRMHRVPRILHAEEKGILRAMPGGVVEHIPGGVTHNHLAWAACLGLRTGIFGKQGDDAEGRTLRTAMDRHGIAHRFVLDGSYSAFADIYVDDAGGRAIYIAPGATSETTPDFVREHHADFIRSAARLTTEVSQLPLETALAVVELAHAAGIPTVVDLDVPPSDAVPGLGDEKTLLALLEATDWIKPAKAAAAELVPGAGEDAAAVAEALRKRFGGELVAVTDGEHGCALATDEGVIRIEALRANEVVDTTGAGDAFLGGLLAARHAGLGWGDAGRLANACGTACVERLGAFPDPVASRARVEKLCPDLVASLAPASIGESGRSAADAALASFDVALEELAALRKRLDPAIFERAVAMIREAGASGARLHVTGVGKPAHVASYAASLLSSTGTPATFLHGTEATHGSAGQVVAGDVVIAISNSGETEELLRTVNAVRALGTKVLAVTGGPDSSLARAADLVLDASTAREGGGLGLAPRASVAAELLVLSSLAAALEEAAGLSLSDYHARHPAGALGKKSRE